MRYSERDLSKSVVYAMRNAGFFVQRIESGATGAGIPDLHYAYKDMSGWIELKVVHQKFDGTSNNIGWRQGQQAWLVEYNTYNKNNAFTLIKYNDCYVFLLMDRIYKTNTKLVNYKKVYHIKELFNET